MKRSRKRLDVRAETIRALSTSDLSRVAGGGTHACGGTGIACPTQQANCPSVGCTYYPQPGCVGTTACDTTAGFCV